MTVGTWRMVLLGTVAGLFGVVGQATAELRSDSDVVKLVRAAPAIVQAACRDAQKHASIRVTCPTLVPRSRYVHRVGLWGSMNFSGSLWAITFNNGDNGAEYV